MLPPVGYVVVRFGAAALTVGLSSAERMFPGRPGDRGSGCRRSSRAAAGLGRPSRGRWRRTRRVAWTAPRRPGNPRTEPLDAAAEVMQPPQAADLAVCEGLVSPIAVSHVIQAPGGLGITARLEQPIDRGNDLAGRPAHRGDRHRSSDLDSCGLATAPAYAGSDVGGFGGDRDILDQQGQHSLALDGSGSRIVPDPREVARQGGDAFTRLGIQRHAVGLPLSVM